MITYKKDDYIWFKYQWNCTGLLYYVNICSQDFNSFQPRKLIAVLQWLKAVQYSVSFLPREYPKFALVNFQKQVKPFGTYFENKYLHYPVHCKTVLTRISLISQK